MSDKSLPVVVKRRPGGGRPVGVKGQTSNQTRENIVQVFEELGGVDAFGPHGRGQMLLRLMKPTFHEPSSIKIGNKLRKN
jgi:hypothetical protein